MALPRKSLALTAIALLALAGCSSGDEDPQASGSPAASVVIATTNFSETVILANIYEQVLKENGVPASVKELGGREVVFPALSKGEVQITPEYLGSLTEFLNVQANGADATQLATGDVDATVAAVTPLAADQNVTLLAPSQAQDQNAFAVTKQFAQDHDLQTLSDLAAYSANNPITLGGPPECPQRPFCQLGLENTYGVQVGEFKSLDAGGPLTVSALNDGTIQVGVVFSSSAVVEANDFVLLTDDKNLQTAENVLPAVYTPALTDQIESALNSVSAVLTTEDLQRMNQQVDVDRMDAADVATQYLQDKGLVA